MGADQLKVGNEYEEKLVKYLNQNHKFWVYNFPKKVNGQPCDIVALKKNINLLIDVKHVRKEEVSFPFDRVEPNQITALGYARNFAKIPFTGFAIFFERDKQWYWFPYDTFMYMYNLGEKSVNKNDLEQLEDFINAHCY